MVNGTGVLLSGEAAQADLSSTVRITGNQTISGVKSFTNDTVFKDNLFYISQPSGQISGAGYTGYYDGGQFLGKVKLTQNNTKIINIAKTWEAKESNRNWSSSAMSSNGQYQTVLNYGGQIYISNNYGDSFLPKDSNRRWFDIAMSSDGKYQTAVDTNVLGSTGCIHISKDYGNTWIINNNLNPSLPSASWSRVAMSSDGKYQIAGGGVFSLGFLYINNDYGFSWNKSPSFPLLKDWRAVAISSDGKYQTVVGSNTLNSSSYNIFTSENYGETWEENSQTIAFVQKARMSSDGKYQTIVGSISVEGSNADSIIVSNNYGKDWKITNSQVLKWRDISMSNDGKFQFASTVNLFNDNITGRLYTSENYGNSWLPTSFTGNIYSCSTSSDAKYQLLTIFEGPLHRSIADDYIEGGLNINGNISGKTLNCFVDINNITGNFNFSGSYNSKLLTINSNQNITGTIVTGLQTGYNVSFVQMGSGQLFITGSGGAVVRQRLNLYNTAGQYGIASLLHYSGNQFILYGDLI
jgi:hypothetical protein